MKKENRSSAKSLIALLLAVLLVSAIGVSAFAAGPDDSSSQTEISEDKYPERGQNKDSFDSDRCDDDMCPYCDMNGESRR